MAKPKTLPREFRAKERVVAVVDMPDIPAATPGKVTDAGDFTTTSVLFSGFIGPDAAPQGPCSAPALTATATSGS